MHRPIRLIAVVAMTFVLAPATGLKAGNPSATETKKKTSLEEIGVAGRDRFRNIGQSYGMEICGNGFIAKKEEIKDKAWPKIQQKCGKFTFEIMNNYTDDPNKLFSLCIGGSLYGCQKAIDIADPCDDLKSCQDYLGVP